MAIVRDNATVGSNSGAQASLTFSHTVAGALRYLVVIVGWRNGTVGSISGVTYDGVAMSLISGNTRSTSRVEMWGLVAPATGSHNVVITHSAGFDNGCRAVAISHTGVDQSTPHGTAQTATAPTGNASVSVTCSGGELVIDGCIGPGTLGTFTAGAGQTQELNGQAGGATATVMASTEPGPGAGVAMTWTFSITPGWASVAVALLPSLDLGPIWRSNETNNYQNSASEVLNKPAGVVDGDILIWFQQVAKGQAVTPAAGWTQLGNPFSSFGMSLNDMDLRIYWKRASSEGSSYTFTFAGSVDHMAQINAYYGCVASGSPFDVTSVVANSSTETTNPTAPAITTVTNNCLIVMSWTYWTGSESGIASPSGYANRGNNVAFWTHDKSLATAGSSGSAAATNAGATTWVAWQMALLPVAGGGGGPAPKLAMYHHLQQMGAY